MRPSLTAAARDGRTILRVGTEEWLRPGPNQRMARHRRVTCRQIRSPNPKLSPLHGTGASPETRVPIPARPGRYEYERNGTANIFLLFAPLEGWRHVEVTDRHAAVDYAHLLRDVSDRWYPNAAKIALVQDNLSTHKPASLYEAFPPAEARRLVERFEWHYTPKLAEHGRNRTQRAVIAVSGQTHCHPTEVDRRGGRLGSGPEQASCEGGLAVHNRRRTNQTEEALSVNMNDSRH